jgi:hypothetical protein
MWINWNAASAFEWFSSPMDSRYHGGTTSVNNPNEGSEKMLAQVGKGIAFLCFFELIPGFGSGKFWAAFRKRLTPLLKSATL